MPRAPKSCRTSRRARFRSCCRSTPQRYLRDAAQGTTGDASKYLSGFSAATLFFPGPSGYDAVLSLRPQDAPDLNLTYAKPVNVQMSGSALLYELDGSVAARRVGAGAATRQPISRHPPRADRKAICATPSCATACRISSRSNASTVPTVRGGCHAARPTKWRCAFSMLSTSSAARRQPMRRASRRKRSSGRRKTSPDFTYFAPGDILPGTGSRGQSGRADDTVYADIRFPMAQAPAYVISQSFMNWGNCDLTGRVGLGGRGNNEAYRCRVNDKPLVNDESKNYAYPWRDNFCEHRGWYVSQCPAGIGHQGEDIRPEHLPRTGPGRRPLLALPKRSRRRQRRHPDALARRPRALSGDRQAGRAHPLPLSAHEPADAGCRRHGQRPPRRRRRSARRRRQLRARGTAAPAITCTSTPRCRPRTAGCSSIPT